MSGTELYHQTAKTYSERGDESSLFSLEIWQRHPWMIDVYTGSVGKDNWCEIADWLRSKMGQESNPYGDAPQWRKFKRGQATINGWTWIGFADQKDYEAFLSAWPQDKHQAA